MTNFRKLASALARGEAGTPLHARFFNDHTYRFGFRTRAEALELGARKRSLPQARARVDIFFSRIVLRT